jgi:large conductance mechanosensitive channel
MIRGFLTFVREQGVVGLAVGFLMGGSVSKMVTSLVTDIVNPLLGIVLGVAGNFREASWKVGSATIMWGNFVANVIDFAVIAAIIYYVVHGLKLDKIDRAKEKKKDK